MTTMLYLARHAEQDLSPSEDPSVGISALGQDQARLLGQRLNGIHHSPPTRARETAYVVAEGLSGVPVRSSDLLRDLTPVPEPGEMSDNSDAELTWLTCVPVEECDPGGREISLAIK